jgi:hypothetical protein
MRKLRFLFQEPGLIEAIASDLDIPMSETELDTPGYRSLWVADLMVDYDPRTGKPYAFMSSSFEKTYPLVIRSLKFHVDDKLFDVPQANLTPCPCTRRSVGPIPTLFWKISCPSPNQRGRPHRTA